MATVNLYYLLLRWYCETVSCPASIPVFPLFQCPVGTWRGYDCETIYITTLLLWNCSVALPAFPSSPCFNTWSEHDVGTKKLYLLLRWYHLKTALNLYFTTFDRLERLNTDIFISIILDAPDIHGTGGGLWLDKRFSQVPSTMEDRIVCIDAFIHYRGSKRYIKTS